MTVRRKRVGAECKKVGADRAAQAGGLRVQVIKSGERSSRGPPDWVACVMISACRGRVCCQWLLSAIAGAGEQQLLLGSQARWCQP